MDCGDTNCVCTVDTNNLFVIDEYETKTEAEKRLEEIRAQKDCRPVGGEK